MMVATPKAPDPNDGQILTFNRAHPGWQVHTLLPV